MSRIHKPFSAEEEIWLDNNWNKYSTWSCVAKAIKERFGINRSADTLRCKMFKRGCIKSSPSTIKYNKEEEEWLKEKLEQKIPHKLIVDEFNKFFVGKTQRILNTVNLAKYAESRGLTYGKRGDPFIMARRQAGSVIHSLEKQMPLGAERRNSKGKLIIKVAMTKYGGELNWKLKKNIEWEKHNNAILPKGYEVICLNGDEDDFSKENLCAVSNEDAQSWYSYKTFNGLKDTDIELKKCILDVRRLKKALEDNGVLFSANGDIVRQKRKKGGD